MTTTPLAATQKQDDDILFLSEFLATSKYVVSITGAGISTESGIPDYRSPNGSYSKGHKPMVHNQFISDELSRKRYWARSSVGWKSFSNAKPNHAHISLARLEQSNFLKHIITQNVDQLHQKAGSRNVIDLHGRNDIVSCLSCNKKSSRNIMQAQLELLNPGYMKSTAIVGSNDKMRADGDAEIGIHDYSKVHLTILFHNLYPLCHPLPVLTHV